MIDLKKEFREHFHKDDQIFNFLQNHALSGMAIREIGGDAAFWADANFWKSLGYQSSRISRELSFWENAIQPEDLELEKRHFDNHLESPKTIPYNLILRFYHKDGTTVWFQVFGQALESATLRPNRLILAFQEITELKRQEELLKRSSQMAKIGFYDWNIRSKNLNWSKVTKEIHGAAQDFEPDFRQAIKFYKKGKSQQKITELVDRALHHGEPFDEELQIVTQSGEEKWVRAIGIPEIREGRALRLYGLFQDIDLQIRTENAIRSERLLYRQVLEGANLGAWDWDIDSDRMTLNRKAAELLGYDLEVMRREGQVYWFDLIHPTEVQRVKNELQNYLVGKNASFEVECRLRKSNDQYRWLSITAKLFQPDLHFQRPRVVGVWKDIHHQQEKMDYYSAFIQEAPLGIAMFDKEMRFINCSLKWREDHKLEDSAIIGKSYYDVFPLQNEKWRSLHLRCLEGEIIRKEEDEFNGPNDLSSWIRWEIRPWFMANVEIGGLIIYTEDISRNKMMEINIAESEKLFRANFKDSKDALIIHDSDGEISELNAGLCELLGYNIDELKIRSLEEITNPIFKKDLKQYLSNLAVINPLTTFPDLGFVKKNGDNICLSIRPILLLDLAATKKKYALLLQKV